MLKTCTFLWEMSLSWRMPSSGVWYRATVTAPRHYNTEAEYCKLPSSCGRITIGAACWKVQHAKWVRRRNQSSVYHTETHQKRPRCKICHYYEAMHDRIKNTNRYVSFSLTETLRGKSLYRSLRSSTLLSVAWPRGSEQPSRFCFNPYSGSQTSMLS